MWMVHFCFGQTTAGATTSLQAAVTPETSFQHLSPTATFAQAAQVVGVLESTVPAQSMERWPSGLTQEM
jgi:hypothetical protein